MAYDGTIAATVADAPVRNDFRRDERLIVLAGGAAVGLVAGVGVALALGRVGMWPLMIGAPLFVFALYLACATTHDAISRRAFGCAMAAGLVVASLFAWPISAMFATSLPTWAGPAAAVASMALLASCWSGASSAVYRLSGQAAIVCAGAAYLGVVNTLS